MKTKEIFKLVIQVMGLVFLYQGLAAVPMAIAAFCPAFPHFVFRNLVPPLFTVGWPFLAAYWMVRGAPPLMRIAYPEKTETTTKETSILDGES